MQVYEDCKSVEQLLQEKEKDILALNGFANGETFSHPDIDNESVKTLDNTDNFSNDDTLDDTFDSHDVSVDSIPNGVVQTDSEDQPPSSAKEFSLITSLLETKANLREMVESASQRGAHAWKKLLKKDKRKESIKKPILTNDDFDGTANSSNDITPKKFLSQTESFDLVLECQTCGKQIIESRQSVLEGKLSDNTIENVECFSCTQERKQRYENEIFVNETSSSFKLSPSSVVYGNIEARGNGSEYVVINGEGTPLQKSASTSSVGSSYSVRL